jgi:beta-galactosidase GanA
MILLLLLLLLLLPPFVLQRVACSVHPAWMPQQQQWLVHSSQGRHHHCPTEKEQYGRAAVTALLASALACQRLGTHD